MCRLALVKTAEFSKPESILRRFSNMARESRAPDGDIQGDGWGISWRESSVWRHFVSALPIWESSDVFPDFPKTNHFLLHARSASFERDKGDVAYNQPYVDETTAFVFNGLLKGVKFPRPLTGSIGAQKIRSLFLESARGKSVREAMKKTVEDLIRHTSKVRALNFGVSDGRDFYVYSQYSQNPEYYTLHFHKSPEMTIVCSEPLEGIAFEPQEPEKIQVY